MESLNLIYVKNTQDYVFKRCLSYTFRKINVKSWKRTKLHCLDIFYEDAFCKFAYIIHARRAHILAS